MDFINSVKNFLSSSRRLELVVKYYVGLKTLLQQSISEPVFCGGFVYKSKSIVGKWKLLLTMGSACPVHVPVDIFYMTHLAITKSVVNIKTHILHAYRRRIEMEGTNWDFSLFPWMGLGVHGL